MANGSPQTGIGWVDTLSRVIVTVGFPVVVAGVLLWFILGENARDMKKMLTRMDVTSQRAEELIKQQTALVEQEQIIYGELQQQTSHLGKIAAAGQEIVGLHHQHLDMLKQVMERQSKILDQVEKRQ